MKISTQMFLFLLAVISAASPILLPREQCNTDGDGCKIDADCCNKNSKCAPGSVKDSNGKPFMVCGGTDQEKAYNYKPMTVRVVTPASHTSTPTATPTATSTSTATPAPKATATDIPDSTKVNLYRRRR